MSNNEAWEGEGLPTPTTLVRGVVGVCLNVLLVLL